MKLTIEQTLKQAVALHENVGAGKHEEKEILQLKEAIRIFNFELRARS